MWRWLGLVVCASTSGWAAHVSDGDGFQIDFEAPGLDTCVLEPRPEVADPDCDDLAALGDQVRQQSAPGVRLVAVAALRGAGWGAPVIVTALPAQRGEQLAQEKLDDLVRGFASGSSEKTKQSTRLTPQAEGRAWVSARLAGTPAVRFVVEGPAPDNSRMLNWIVFGEKGAYNVSFVGTAAHEAELVQAAERVMATVTLPVLLAVDSKPFGQPSAFEQGRRVGRVIGMVVPPAAVVLLALGYARRRKAARAPS
jgi:hypothetical protein